MFENNIKILNINEVPLCVEYMLVNIKSQYQTSFMFMVLIQTFHFRFWSAQVTLFPTLLLLSQIVK